MRQAAVNQKLLPAASGPVLARLVPAEEFKDLAGLRVEYGRRINELTTAREENEKLTQEKRSAQDLYVQSALEASKLRHALVMAEKQLHDERARWEGVPSKIAEILTLWREHSRDCDDGCVAGVKLPKDISGETLVRSFGYMPYDVVPADELLHEAMDGGSEDLLRLVAGELARAISGSVPLFRSLCGEPVENCDPCMEHEVCVEPSGTCPDCADEEFHSTKADMDRDARKGGDRD